MDILLNFGKIFLAILLGGLIGLEREKQDKPAGLRTCMLVTVASTMVVIFSQVMLKGNPNLDIMRAPAYMLSGINFLGAGIIMAKQNKIEGITTAAILLVLVPLGLLVGIGTLESVILAIGCAIVTFLILELKRLEIKFKWNKKPITKKKNEKNN